ncbi:MAG: 2-hydroxyacyl-CoA dehydratase family protein [Deltaproteobacteria bacterium]|jgi:benzoyl-CoA reductase/2-hydroxyglutaryl-CoA dehydratase subunit BcrC/BadD/HgdB|nr:2-hydroxyacyl-CoA dehydratase family protein [Deltaproteobacteria bacterium]
MINRDERQTRVLTRAKSKRDSEWAQELKNLRNREDYFPEVEYFLSLYEDNPSPKTIAERTGKPVVGILCLQAPVELFLAQGFAPIKIYSGSQGAVSLTSPHLPALMCPALKAVLGELQMEPSFLDIPLVLPLTCDWMVKFKEARELFGDFFKESFFLQLPRCKESPRAPERFLEELYDLSQFLEKVGGQKLKKDKLLAAIKSLEEVRWVIYELIRLRHQGKIGALYFTTILGSFFLGPLDLFIIHLKKALATLKERPISNELGKRGIFLSGSPIYFPNFKTLYLLEQAGLLVLGDDLCSSERLLPHHVEVTDRSLSGLLLALADSYHRACLCPVFAENERRASLIREALEDTPIRGVVFHLLKGCHPYELDSFSVEEKLKDWELKYLKIETDYSAEDRENLLTRLEAFLPTLAV